MTKEKTRISIVGWGNVGKGVFHAIRKNPDMSLTSVISRNVSRVLSDKELYKLSKTIDKEIPVYSAENLREISIASENTDVAVLCGGSATDLPKQAPIFSVYFNTVDSFDTHADIPDYEKMVDSVARFHKHTAMISNGWDPGFFSFMRIMGDAVLPGSTAYTFWGPGVSQGHSQAIRAVEGVADGIQYTLPSEDALDKVRQGNNPQLTTRQKHTRDCFIALKEGADENEVRKRITTMPKYFADYDTTVTIETPEQIAERKKSMPHGGFVMISGETGEGNKALIEYRNEWKSNPEATGSILVACARACHRLNIEGKLLTAGLEKSDLKERLEQIYFGAKTMSDVPTSYYSPHSKEVLLKKYT